MFETIRAVFTLVITLLPLASHAQQFFCEMTDFVIIDEGGPKVFDNEKFMMRVVHPGVSFSAEGYLKNAKASIDLWRSPEEWSATFLNTFDYVDSIYRYGDGVLNVSIVFHKQITSIRAKCTADR